MKINHITLQDCILANVSGYFCSRSSLRQSHFCALLQQLTHRKNVQFALVQGVSPIDAIVAQINEPTVQGTLVYTKVPYGDGMLVADLMLDTHYKAESIAYLTTSAELRWPDFTNINERETTKKIDSLLELWNKLETLEQQIKTSVTNSEEAIRLLWQAAGITFEYSSTFKDEMFSYVTRQGYEHHALVPYIMRAENWRSEQWYPSLRLL